MVSGGTLRVCAVVLVVFLVVAEMTSAAPSLYTDYDNLRDLYELLLRNEGVPPISRYNHQMERKGGRSPSLRLRFGRRADPVWSSLSSSSEGGPAEGNSN